MRVVLVLKKGIYNIKYYEDTSDMYREWFMPECIVKTLIKMMQKKFKLPFEKKIGDITFTMLIAEGSLEVKKDFTIGGWILPTMVVEKLME